MKKLDETEYLLRSKKNAERLLSAIESVKSGQGKRLSIRQLKQEVGLSSRKKH